MNRLQGLVPAIVTALLAAPAAMQAAAAELTVDQVRAALKGASSTTAADLSGKDLSDLDLSRLDFRNANLKGASFFGSKRENNGTETSIPL